jgi:probable rRNA maturation factor
VRAGEFSIALLSDAPILEMNRRWLSHDWIPDVLSFALHEDGEAPIGDIYIGIEQARRQARDHAVTLDEELVRLCIHGTLHVLGYDHDAGSAEALEDPDSATEVLPALFVKQEVLVRRVMNEVSGPAAGQTASRHR